MLVELIWGDVLTCNHKSHKTSFIKFTSTEIVGKLFDVQWNLFMYKLYSGTVAYQLRCNSLYLPKNNGNELVLP